MLGRMARWSYVNPWKMVAIWVLGAGLIMALSGMVGPTFDGGMTIPASQSKDGFDVIDRYFGEAQSGQSGSIVVRAERGDLDDPQMQDQLGEFFAEVAKIDGVSISSPLEPPGSLFQVSEDRTIAFASLNSELKGNTANQAIGEEVLNLAKPLDNLEVEVGGASFAGFEPPQSELIGVAFAIVILIFAFGSVLAMGLPIGVAIAGVATGGALVGLMSNVMAMPEFSTTIGAMIGLGVGIDYALFIVTRYREERHAGQSGVEAMVIANETAGRAVLFAGMTVVVSLLGMLLIGLPFVSGLGVGSAVTVVITMTAALTLLPALLGFAKDRVEITRVRGLVAAGCVALALLGLGLNLDMMIVFVPVALVVLVAGTFIPQLSKALPPRKQTPMKETLSYKWSRSVQAHPWLALLVGGGFLVLLAIPVTSLRLGFSDEGNFPPDSTTRKAYDLLGEGFGPGFNGPLIIPVVADAQNDAAKVSAFTEALAADPGIAKVFPAMPAPEPRAGEAVLIRAIPTSAPQDEVTEETVRRIRTEIVEPARADGVDAYVTGFVPVAIDFSSYMGERTVLFFGVVLALSFVLLMMVFRSVLVPLKAVVMNMLSIGAAYGVVVALFQWGWFGSLTGIEPAPVEPFIPMMMFAILFGLSMDYEVFLLSRVREEFVRTGDPVGSVADGLAATARVISAAAAIMVAVFGAFVLEDNRIPQLFGVGLAVAVLLDATLVRMLLVPATMELLGDKNWWLPKWLDRILPRISVEGPPGHESATMPPEGTPVEPASA